MPLASPRPPTLTDDEALVLALRLRDGRPDRVRAHRDGGACRYIKFYPDGGCDWCQAFDRSAAAQAPVQPDPAVLIMPLRWRHVADEDVMPVLRSA